jgi:heavy metal translocating P-type ATPase
MPGQKYRPLLMAFPVVGLLLGFANWSYGTPGWTGWIWAGFSIPALVTLLIDIGINLRRGNLGLDIVAAMSITAALVFREELAAIVVALMYAGGQYLESYAERHARREMTALLARVPRIAIRYRAGQLEEIALGEVSPGDRLLVRRGDVVAVDGVVVAGLAILDQAALTGESIPIQQGIDAAVMSGSTNVGDAFDLVASHSAEKSTYAGIVRMVESAQCSRAPMARLADRFALAFLGLTSAIAGGAWLLTGDPIRAVAVLVVATPCPLILAVPVALVAGLSRAAEHGILIKGGGALEMLARVRALVIDKTGTLTDGSARIASIEPDDKFPATEILRLGASLDQASKHVVAQAIVDEARRRDLTLSIPLEVIETPGEGLEGVVDDHRVAVGGLRFVEERTAGKGPRRGPKLSGTVVVAVAVDGQKVGQIVLADKLRVETKTVLEDLRKLGLERIVLATGDRKDVADAVVAGLSIDAVRADLSPDQKVLVVLSERKNGPVLMVGDGVNDAPALAAADVGLAMGAKGASASAEAADVVLLVDRLDRLVPAIRIARRSRTIAVESVYAGIGLSILGMIAASFGYITPVQGAILQEAIDVAAILNALRALKGGFTS